MQWKLRAGALLAAAALVATLGTARAQDAAANYPNKPIHLIIGFGAGGGTDLLARIVGPKLSEILGRPVIIENRTGAGGRIAVDYVQNQPADGHTVLVGAIGQLAVASAIYPKLSFHPTRTLTPVTMIASYPLVVSGPMNDEIKTIKDLVAYGKAHPDKANYPTSSPTFTISSELFKLKTGMPGQAIPYRSTNEMLLSVIKGQSLFVFADSGITAPLARSGKVRAFAVASAKRIDGLPDVPTMAEAGLGNIDIPQQWIGAFLAAKTPPAIVAKFEAAIRKAVADAGVRAGIQKMAYEPEGNAGSAFRARIDGDIKTFQDVVAAAKLKFEM